MTVEAPVKQLTAQELADLIQKGRERYPDTIQARHDYVVFDWNEDTLTYSEKPNGACALGFAVLGMWNGDVQPDNQEDYANRLHQQIPGTLGETVIYWNDDDDYDLDQIIDELRNWKDS